tara:strand:+ start:16939 stop:17346 length:408 start_codon:yes stop_codon:yes gene_type:complete
MDETENLELSDLDTETSASPEGDGAQPMLDASDLEPLDMAQEVVPADGADDDPTLNAAGLGAVYDIPVQIAAVLGTSQMQVSQLLKLGRGAVVELDRKVGEAIDIYVNNRLVARGEVVVVNERLGVTMTEIIKAD